MGGQGFMRHASESLKQNRGELRRKGLFKKERSFLNLKEADFNTPNDSIESKKLSKKELKKYKEKTVRSRTKDELYYALIAYASAAILIVLFIYIATKTSEQEQTFIAKEKVINYEENIEKYNYLISSGDDWLKQRKYHNAAFQYRLALELFPNDSIAVFRLTSAYDLNCEINQKNCGESDKLLENYVMNH